MLVLERSYLDNCTIGKISYYGKFVCYGIERPWLNNEPNISCVPAGVYDLERYDSAQHPHCFALLSKNLGVGLTSDYHRSYCLIHIGNFVEDVSGCIAPGLGLHPDRWGVCDSRLAMDKLRSLIENESIKQIHIR